MNRRLHGSLLLSIAVMSAPGAARAEPVLKAADTGKLEDVVVTAQRREESAQSVGVALSVLTADALKDAGVAKVNDLQTVTPSLEVEPAFGSGQPQFRLRGVGFIDYTSNNASPVGVSLDGVSLPFPIQTQGQLFDLSRVEVLRGPQGTLYGRNTTGGAVNFIGNRPTADLAGGVDVSFGSHNALVAEAFVSGPLADGLRGRLAVATEQGGAWQHNRLTDEKLGDKDKVAARVQLEWDASASTNLRLALHTSKDRSDAFGLQFFSDFKPTSGGAVIPADTSAYATGWSALRPSYAQALGIGANAKPGVDNSNNGASLDVNVDLGGVRLTSITAYNKLERREFGDWDASQYHESDEFFRSTAKVFSEEARLASTGTGPLGWVGGVYYSNEKLHEDFYGDFYQRLGGAALTDYEQDGKSLGVFGQASYRFSDRLKGILGLRYEHETRELKDLSTLFAIGDPVNFGAAFNLSGGNQSRSLSNSDVSGKAGLEYQLAERALLYGNISRGVKSGGFTAHNTLTGAAVDPFKPETLLAYELGIKADVTSTLRLNAAAFYYDYKDQQILSKFFDVVSQSPVGRFINAPKSRIDGVEVELEWRPVPELEISQYFGYKTGKYTDAIKNSDDVEFNGRDLDFPKTSYGGAVGYTWSVGSYRLRAETNYSYRDRYPQLFLLGPQFTVDSYWLANASVSLSPAVGSSWTLSLWGRNVTNQRYYLTKNYFLPQTNVAAAGQPATVGARLSWKF
jgi:iron complex outermembrane recepter protein